MNDQATSKDTHRLKVLHLGSPAGLFGAERWILALVRKLPDFIESHVGVIDDRTQDASDGHEPPLCIEARHLGFDAHAINSPGRFNPHAISRLREVIRTHGIDIVHTHYYKPTLIAALAVMGTRCRLIVTPHGWSTDAGLTLQVYEALERVAMLRAHAVAPLSPDLLNGLARIPGLSRRLHLIQNGVDLDEVDETHSIAPAMLAARARGEFTVGYIGQLIPRKKVDDLVRAFARLRGPRRLVILGDGPSRSDLESVAHQEGIADLTEFAGFRPDRLSYLKGFDVLVLPSSLEGIPRCLMEGMAARVPIVGSDIAGIRELIRHDQTGALFECGNVEQLSSILERLQSSTALRLHWGEAGERHVREYFSAQSMAVRYASLYRKVVPEFSEAPAVPMDQGLQAVRSGDPR